MLDTISIRQLRSFVSVAQYGGFTAVAGMPGLIQPAVTARVKQLEHHLCIRLFDRSAYVLESRDEAFELAEENLDFEPGDVGFPAFRTPIGRMGMFICYDCRFPESFRLCALQGADIVCVPTNWVPTPGRDPKREAMANILRMAAAHSNSIFIAAADRIGTERGQEFIGQSLIVSYTGWPIAGPAGYDREEIIHAEANLADARRKRNRNAYNQMRRDRRSDVDAEMSGADLRPGWHGAGTRPHG
jgi:predicted amidohydrolase